MPSTDTAPSSADAARVIGVKENLVTVRAPEGLTKNEVAYIRLADRRLKAEVLRVMGDTADLQVYEPTDDVAVGAPVELTGELLSVELGPGLLGQVFDGLQNPLYDLAQRDGFFLQRGSYADALDRDTQWSFTARVSEGDRLEPGQPLGEVSEGRFPHRILVPWDLGGPVTVDWIQQGTFPVDTPVARLRDEEGEVREVNLIQRAPVRRPIPERLLAHRRARRVYPREPLPTTIRLVDTFFPIAKGGTGCIPGPFGAGKTVLQNLIASYSTADIVIIIACGERAGEVVETISEFPHMTDPRTGGSLMDRTIIVANTSSMPVAARESSIYTGMTMGEYYRQMGFDVLTIADSTSRWAQAMRETSGRMEEIPGEEAFPAYLDSAIKTLYERAGVLANPDGSTGSLTLIGTVSPAGGNFQEPVTQATLNTVKTFLGLSADRAYKRYYPAVDPLISWSRYLEQLDPWFRDHMAESWSADVRAMLDLLKQGDSIHQLVQVTGEEGITLDDFILWQKAQLVDMVYLQQDAFDPVDVSMSLGRQRESFYRLKELVDRDYGFEGKEAARDFFTRLTGLYRNLHYSEWGSDDYRAYRRQIAELVDEHATAAHDPLANALGPRQLRDLVEREIDRAGRTSAQMALVLLTVDGLGAFRDREGDEAAEGLMRSVAQVVERESRAVDYLARWDTDRFALLVPGTPLSGARRFAERTREEIRETPFRAGQGTVSLGVTELASDDDADRLIQRAEKALARASDHGGDAVETLSA